MKVEINWVLPMGSLLTVHLATVWSLQSVMVLVVLPFPALVKLVGLWLAVLWLCLVTLQSLVHSLKV